MKNKKSIPFYYFLIFVFCFVVMTSCSSPTESSKGSLVGIVNLEGEVDHSGIKIAIYDLAYLDTTIVRINNQYPQIGIHINQHTEFDHRLQSPVKYTNTSTDGSFELTKISTGRYNLVAIKDGWGFKYLYEVEVSKGNNEISQQLILFEERHISGNIQENITVETDHHLIIDDETVFLPNTSSLTIQPGAVIRINSGVDLTIHGTLTAQGEENNMFWVTSNDGFDQDIRLNINNRDEIAIFNSMELSSFSSVENDLIEWGKWDYGNNSFNSQVSNIVYQDLYFNKCESGIAISDVSNIFISNVVSMSCSNGSSGGIVAFTIDNLTIQKNILTSNYNGIYLKNSNNTTIENNFIVNNYRGIWGLTIFGDIEHNEFVENTECDIRLASNTVQGDIWIRYNNLSSEIGIWQNPQGSLPYFCNMVVNYNNFYSNEWFIIYHSTSFSPNNDIDGRYNFFDFLNSESLIFDRISDSWGTYEITVIVDEWVTMPIIEGGINF